MQPNELEDSYYNFDEYNDNPSDEVDKGTKAGDDLISKLLMEAGKQPAKQ